MKATSPSAKPRLADFGYNKYSQYGEDGVIEKIFDVIGTGSKLCIEFGAWDGFHLANTANLWTQGWKGVLIEGDRRRFDELLEKTRAYQCTCINAFVARDGVTRLESLLDKAGVSGTIDLLSIDIDGDDYSILASLERLRPRVIICEYNPTIPAELDLYAGYGNNFGSSVTALKRLAHQKGYDLVALTPGNCFFVLREEVAKLAAFEMGLDSIRCDDHLTYLITSYAGDYVISRRAPYGFGYPYRGALIGPIERASARSVLLRWWFDFVGIAKRGVKRLLRRA